MMSEYIMQVAMKVELSTDVTKQWSYEDILELLKVSLDRLFESQEDDAEVEKLNKDKVNLLVEALKQYPVKLIKAETSSYLFLKSIKYYFYVGNLDDNYVPQRYNVFSCVHDNKDITGKTTLSHSIATEDGELRVSGVMKLTPKPKDLKIHIDKIASPKSYLERYKRTAIMTARNRSVKDVVDTTKSDKVPNIHLTASPKITKKATKTTKIGKKSSALKNMLSIIAPGTSSLFTTPNENTDVNMQSEEEDEGEYDANVNVRTLREPSI